MALTNLGFEEIGSLPGDAQSWTTSVTAAEYVAAWGAGSPPLDEESFDVEWVNDAYLFAFETSDTSPTLLDTSVSAGEAVEDFEEGWSDNQGYLFADASADAASFDASLTPQSFEDFEDGWDAAVTAGNDYDFTMGSLVSAFFDAAFSPQGYENFEDGWDASGVGVGNDYDTTLVASTAALFDGSGADSVEDFEDVFQEVQVTATAATDVFTSGPNHDLNAGDRVTFRVGVGALPAPINSSYFYFVIASGLSVTTFKVSLTSGGTAVDVTDAGVGDYYVAGDPTRFWILPA